MAHPQYSNCMLAQLYCLFITRHLRSLFLSLCKCVYIVHVNRIGFCVNYYHLISNAVMLFAEK